MPRETGLNEQMEAQGENITTIKKELLIPPRTRVRTLGSGPLKKIARAVVLGMGIPPSEIAS
jgi:hypothetical protein